MFKKITVLTFLLLAFPVVASADFPDVYTNNPHYDAILYVQDEGIVEGYPDGSFQPQYPVNRAEFMKILIGSTYDMAEIESCTEKSFSDVPETEWYAMYVCMGKKKGIVHGYPDGSFRPTDTVNFVEAAKMIANTFEGGQLSFEEIESDKWYEPYVNYLADRNAIPVVFSALDEDIDRQEMAEIIYRLGANVTDKPSLTLDEIGDLKIIEEYYSYFAYANHDEAYAMKYQPTMSLEAFKNLYLGFPYAQPENFEKHGPHTYSFIVMTLPPTGEKRARYAVEMEVIDGKLKTYAADLVKTEVLEEITFDDSLSATLEWDDGTYMIFIIKDGVKELASEDDTSEALAIKIKNLKFSPHGKYLTYHIEGWEYGGLYVYDIENKVRNEDSFGGSNTYGFTNDDQIFYFCSLSGMAGGKVFVMNLPGFEMKRDLVEEDKFIESCGPFDEFSNILHYGIYEFEKKLMHYYEYDVDTDEVREVF